MPARLRFHQRIVADAFAGLAQLRDHARIDQPNHIKIDIVVAAQLDDARDIVGFRYQRGARLGFADILQRLLARNDEVLRHADIGALHHLEVAVDHQRERQAADRHLGRQELLEAFAVRIEQRLRARHILRHRKDVAADHLRVFLKIGFRDQAANSR